MQTVAYETDITLRSLLSRVQSGEEILITLDGKPVARLVPDGEAPQQAESQAAFNRIRARSTQLGKFDWEELKHDRDNGRP